MLVGPPQHTLQHVGMNSGVAHNAAFAHLLAPGFELRLDQRDDVSLGFQPACHRGRISVSEMNDASIVNRSIGSGSEVR